VFRIYWDGDPLPAVETPRGDFFGLGLGEYFTWESSPILVGSARLTINTDWEKHASLPEDAACFYAEYRQAAPNRSWTDDWTLNRDPKVNNKTNLSGEDNYVFLEAEGGATLWA
jgi:D-arabinan exo alpha-(1,3)/(1,5)-arabinofuranosidase (non-reducing end)